MLLRGSFLKVPENRPTRYPRVRSPKPQVAAAGYFLKAAMSSNKSSPIFRALVRVGRCFRPPAFELATHALAQTPTGKFQELFGIKAGIKADVHSGHTTRSEPQVPDLLLGICLALFLALSSGKPSAETPQLLSSFAVAFVPPLTRVPGHGPSTSQTPAYTLPGTVFDSLANKPIQNALVLLYLDAERAVLTGSDGAFQFDGLLVSGQGSITAQKPGYFSPQDVRLAGHSSQTIATITMALPALSEVWINGLAARSSLGCSRCVGAADRDRASR
jgi:Carboxypeptidase regulatory-like domain